MLLTNFSKSIHRLCSLLLVISVTHELTAQEQKKPPLDQRFIKHVITSDFISEGVAVADINRDGKTDIVSGAYWFEAPAWEKHEIAPGKKYNPATEFSNAFLNF